MVLRLFAFILVLMPGWAALLRYYFFDSFIIRNIDFGKGPRFRLVFDLRCKFMVIYKHFFTH